MVVVVFFQTPGGRRPALHGHENAAKPARGQPADERAERTAAIPHRLPVVPGIADLVPWARGGMGIVYRGRDLALNRPVAVKVIWPAAAGCERTCERAKREALTLARTAHPNVVAVHAAGEADGSPYLVMEWVDGPNLQHRIARSLPSPRQAARIVRDLARAVGVVHAFGIIHREIKPDNVLLAGPAAANWERCIPKLADFGLARPLKASRSITQYAKGLGTPAFMAPEQTGLADHLGAVGPAVDIRGLGSLAFALLTGRAPYTAATAMASLQRAADGDVAMPAVFREAPRDLQAIVEKCLEQQPQRRDASADALADDLDRFLTGRPVQAQPLSTLARLGRTARRKPVHSIAVGLAIAFVTTALGSTAWHAASGARVASSQAQAEVATAVAARSMERLTGELIEKMVLRSRPDDEEHVDFLRGVRDEFAAWPLGNDPAEGLGLRLTGLRRVAGLFFDVSEYEEALLCHQQSLEVLDELARLDADPVDIVWERLKSLQLKRRCLYHLGQHSDAEASARASIALLDSAPAEMAGRDLALAQEAMELGAFQQEQQRFEEASATLTVALAGFRRLRNTRPDDVDLTMRESHALAVAQLCFFRAGQFEACRQLLERLVDETGGFLDAHPVDAMPPDVASVLTKNVGLGCAQLSRLAAREGHIEEAIGHVLAQRDVCQAFVDTLPADVIDPVHKELVDAGLHAATLMMQAGRAEEASAAVERAEQTARLLYETRPGVFDNAYLIGWVHWMHGDIARSQGNVTAALAYYREIVTLLKPWRENPACREMATVLITNAEGVIEHLGGTAEQVAHGVR